MSFGFRAANNNGVVTISDTETHMVYRSRGEFVVSAKFVDVEATGSVTFSSPVTTTDPPNIFVRVKSATLPSIQLFMIPYGSSGNWTGFGVIAGAYGGTVLPNHVLEYVVCVSTPVNTSLSGWGMVIYDGGSTNKMIFNSNDILVKHNKFTKKWNFNSISSGTALEITPIGINILSDEFIALSSTNMPPAQMNINGTWFSYNIWKNNAPNLSCIASNVYLYYDNGSYPGWPENSSTMLHCIPICKFPTSIYKP